MCSLVILHMPFLLSSCGFFLVFGCRISFGVGPSLFLSMILQELVVILVFSWEERKSWFLSRAPVFATPWTVAHQAPLSWEEVSSILLLHYFISNSCIQFSSVQSLSRVQLFATPWIAACQASLSITNSQSSLKLTSIESVMPSSHLILCRPLLLLPSIPPSITVFPNESALRMRWPKYWSFSFSIIPSTVIPMDWLDLLAVQGTLKSLLQHHSSKASIIQHSAFFTCISFKQTFSLQTIFSLHILLSLFMFSTLPCIFNSYFLLRGQA